MFSKFVLVIIVSLLILSCSGAKKDAIYEPSNKLNPCEVLLLENIRFFKEEENDDENFARNLSKLGDIYINEAFSCSHRKQASIHTITKFIDSYGGPGLKKEIDSINLMIKNKIYLLLI